MAQQARDELFLRNQALFEQKWRPWAPHHYRDTYWPMLPGVQRSVGSGVGSSSSMESPTLAVSSVSREPETRLPKRNDRRAPLTRFLTSVLVVSLFACALPLRREPVGPNVLLIVADDLGVGDVSPTGSPLIETPAIDGLAASGGDESVPGVGRGGRAEKGLG